MFYIEKGNVGDSHILKLFDEKLKMTSSPHLLNYFMYIYVSWLRLQF